MRLRLRIIRHSNSGSSRCPVEDLACNLAPPALKESKLSCDFESWAVEPLACAPSPGRPPHGTSRVARSGVHCTACGNHGMATQYGERGLRCCSPLSGRRKEQGLRFQVGAWTRRLHHSITLVPVNHPSPCTSRTSSVATSRRSRPRSSNMHRSNVRPFESPALPHQGSLLTRAPSLLGFSLERWKVAIG